MIPYFEKGGVTLYLGDCREVMAALPECSVDAIVTDPPYELGFMGKRWDNAGVAYDLATWAAALRVLKPGGHMLAFGAPRNYHRMACAIEDAGFEIRDCLQWLFGSGFPKSLNLHGEWEGWGTALKPAYEPIVMARKPLVGTVAANVAAWGTGGLNIDGCRIEGAGNVTFDRARDGRRDEYRMGTTANPMPSDKGRWPANVLLGHSDECWRLDDCECMGGHDSTKKHTYYLSCARDCPVRLLDAQSGDITSGFFSGHRNEPKTANTYGTFELRDENPSRPANTGGASRFFYTAKTSRAEREYGLTDLEPTRRSDGRDKDIENPRLRTNERRNDHPTVKPVDLMRWLCRLVTPPGGIVLDPFLGSGSTGMAALDEGCQFWGIDMEGHYLEIARRRITRRHVMEPLPQSDAGQAVLL